MQTLVPTYVAQQEWNNNTCIVSVLFHAVKQHKLVLFHDVKQHRLVGFTIGNNTLFYCFSVVSRRETTQIGVVPRRETTPICVVPHWSNCCFGVVSMLFQCCFNVVATFQCCFNVSTFPCLLLQSWIATRPDEQRDTLTKLFMSYVGEENPVEPGIMFDFIGRNCKEAMKTPKAGRASSCLVLLQSLLDDDDVELSASFGPDAQNDLNGEIERIFLYCICWSIGGLLEADDRTKFDAFLR